jgi:hypothetical protein
MLSAPLLPRNWLSSTRAIITALGSGYKANFWAIKSYFTTMQYKVSMLYVWHGSLTSIFSKLLYDLYSVPFQSVNMYCFNAFLSIPPAQFKLVLDSVIWAFKHTMRNVADTGLNILFQLLQNVAGQENNASSQSFYHTYYTDILQHMFSVVTDTSHTAGLTMHATILAYMFTLVENNKVSVSLNPQSQTIAPGQTAAAANIIYVQVKGRTL